MDGLSLGIQFIVIVVMFVGAGYLIDGNMGNKFPIVSIIFLLIGFAVALYTLLKESSRLSKSKEKTNKKTDTKKKL